MADLAGVSHISLTVTDLERSERWYCDVFGLVRVFEERSEGHEFVVLIHPGTKLMIGLHIHGSNDGSPCSEFDTGLDHIGFHAAGRADLEAWIRIFEERGVQYTPIVEVSYGQVLSFRDPDNIPLEFFAPRCV